MGSKPDFLKEYKQQDSQATREQLEAAWQEELERRAQQAEREEKAAEREEKAAEREEKAAEREEKRQAAEREEKRQAAEREEKRQAAEREEKRQAAEREHELAKLRIEQQRGGNDMFVPTVSLSEFILGSHFYSLLVSSPTRTEKRKLV
jgi:flagellar biosynthesis GTPase FlhF